MADGFLLRAVAVVVLLAVASLLWWLIARRRGTLRAVPASVSRPGREPVRLDELGVGAGGKRLSLVQFSSPHCAPCRRSSRLWRELTDRDSQVTFTEVQAEDHLALLGRLGVLTTPTTAVFGRDGELSGLIAGPPSPAQLADLGPASASHIDADLAPALSQGHP